MSDQPERIVNSMGHVLVECMVLFDTDPPRARTRVSFYPIVAYELRRGGTYEPLLVSGKVKVWGDIRASVAGGVTYGVCNSPPNGVTTATHSFRSLEQFVDDARRTIAFVVDNVRREKGYQSEPDRFDLIKAASDENLNDWLAENSISDLDLRATFR
jgi:hypothetical protein